MPTSSEPTLIDIKYSYVSTFLHNLIEQYQEIERQCYELLENDNNDRLINDNASEDKKVNCAVKKDKTPVWVLWWQGEKNAPEIIRICLKSMRENFPEKCSEIRLLTAENIEDYVTLPTYITQKYNHGIISLTHLSDIIRASLLSEYGGMWIDATYFVAGKVSENIFETDEIWTQRFEHPLWTADVVQGRWSINLIKGQAHELLFDFWKDALLFYWQKHDSVVDYYLTDYIIASAYENFQSVREEIEQCECSNPELFTLREIINEPFGENRWEKVCEATQFFKLSYKVDYQDVTEDGRQTFYGYMKAK